VDTMSGRSNGATPVGHSPGLSVKGAHDAAGVALTAQIVALIKGR
jgi:hypothetical protein